MPQRHCPKCGAFQVTPTPQADLFGGPLPVPGVSDPFAAFHRESQRREAEARRRGINRQIGAERRARRDFTHQSLRGTSQ